MGLVVTRTPFVTFIMELEDIGEDCQTGVDVSSGESCVPKIFLIISNEHHYRLDVRRRKFCHLAPGGF